MMPPNALFAAAIAGSLFAEYGDYPMGSMWTDEQTAPMQDCVEKFSFKQEGFRIIPPLPDAKAKLEGVWLDNEVMMAKVNRLQGCKYNCAFALSEPSGTFKLFDQVTCYSTGKS